MYGHCPCPQGLMVQALTPCVHGQARREEWRRHWQRLDILLDRHMEEEDLAESLKAVVRALLPPVEMDVVSSAACTAFPGRSASTSSLHGRGVHAWAGAAVGSGRGWVLGVPSVSHLPEGLARAP